MINIRVSTAGLALDSLPLAHMPEKLEQAKKWALQKAEKAIKTQAVRLTVAKYTVKPDMIRKAMTASISSSGLNVMIRGKRLGLDKYTVLPNRNLKKAKFKASVFRGGNKPLGPRVFWYRGKIFRRQGGRLPIKRLFGPSVPEIVGNQETIDALSKEGYDVLKKEFKRQVMRQLGVMK